MVSRIAIIAPGAMGSAVGRRLVANGARVLTLIEGRSERTKTRAHEAGMIAASASDVAGADLILSIVPPAEALPLAESLIPALTKSQSKPAFIDFNAINPNTMKKVSAALAGTGCEVLDGAIIGLPPAPGKDGPAFYVSGDSHHRGDALLSLGLKLRHIDGPIGAASALKMVYAGVNKGSVALGTAMLLASIRAGCEQALAQQMGESLPHILAHFSRTIPDMYPKSYRWVTEMHEIADFLGPDNPAAGLFEAAARVFAMMAWDHGADGALAAKLNSVLDPGGRKGN